MNKNEQDMIRKIKEKSEQVPVPKALEPRQIEAKLAERRKKCGLRRELVAGSRMPGADRGSDGIPELF